MIDNSKVQINEGTHSNFYTAKLEDAYHLFGVMSRDLIESTVYDMAMWSQSEGVITIAVKVVE